MKKNYLLILLLLFMFRASGQNCNFSYQSNPGTTIVNFSPNSAYIPNQYYFVWNLGDGTIDSTAFPIHTYNGVGPYVVCYEIFDLISHVRVCTACDSIYLGSMINCFFTYSNVGTFFTFNAVGNPQGGVTWDFGDGGVGFGPAVNYDYLTSGQFTVTMTVTDTSNGSIICTNSMVVNSPGTSTSCSFSATAQGLVATFAAANVGPNSLVQWTFGDGINGTGYQVTHQYAVGGTYTVCMTATDVNGAPCTTCQQVTVSGSPGNCYYTYFPDSINQSTYYFSAVPAYPFTNIVWDYGDGSTGTGSFTSHSFPVAGTYNVCMSEIDTAGIVCTSCQQITITNTPNCSFSSSVSILNPLTLNFQANGGNTTITWDFGDGSTGTGASTGHTYAVPGIYQVCMSVGTPGTSNFCMICNLVSVGNTTNFCNITYYPDPLSPSTIVFTSTGSSPNSTLMWDFGDNTIGTGQSVSHTYNTPGVYNVCVIERDAAQNVICQSCISIQVGGGGGTVCQASFLATSNGLDGYFIDMSVTNNPLTQYSWDFGDGSSSSLQFPQHTYAIPGLYNVCLTISDSSCTDVFCSPLLVDTGAFNPGNGCNAFYAFIQLAPYQVTVVNLSSGLNLSFDWDFGDGSPHDSNAYPSHVYSSIGSYNLCLTVSDANGCSSSYCDTLSVDSLGNIYRMATPGFTLNVVSPAMITGVNDPVTENTFGVYPNPFTSELHVSLLNASKKAEDFRIFSVQGAEIMKGKMEGSNGIINTQSLSSGIYLLELTMNDGSRSFQRVIKN